MDLVVSYAWHQLLLGRTGEALQTVPQVIDMILKGVPGLRE
jgi:hypothetical protein